ncbi:ATP-binding protein [Motiliproteus sp.]|uniref:ATP-binding protein n=1 Tax=Motiliproteus sp. TaxID=1898955 RepID=UPI003BACF222
MQLTLRLKLFLILVTTSVALILSMLFFTLSSFEVGVSDYLSEVNAQRMEKLSRRLAQLHQRHGSFEFLEQDPVLAAALEGLLWEGESEAELLDEIPEEELAELEYGFVPLIFILDPDRQPLYGDYDPQAPARLQPIEQDGQPLGWLGIREDEFGDGTVTFIEAQTREFWIIAVIMVLVSMLAALISAQHFQRAIRPLIRGTRALTQGHYRTRIDVTSKDELGDLSRDFNQLATTLEQNEQARRKWVEDISHELKTPLTLMRGEIEAVQDGLREMTPATLELLSQDIDRLNHLVDDLKALWQSEPDALQLETAPCRIDQLLRQCLGKFETQLAAQQLKLSCELEADIEIIADQKRLTQVIDNLLTNSLRYTDQPGELKISLKRTNSRIQLCVEDSGPGVGDGDLPRLFDRLYRVERSRNRSLGGFGIGLAICRNIIQAHQGRIEAHHSELGGLRIEIELPGDVTDAR